MLRFNSFQIDEDILSEKRKSKQKKSATKSHNIVITPDKTHKIPVGESINHFKSRYSKYLKF